MLSIVFVERSTAHVKTGWLAAITGTEDSKECKVTAQRGRMKNAVSVEGEKLWKAI